MIERCHDSYNDNRLKTLQESFIQTIKSDKKFADDFFYKGYYEFDIEKCLSEGSYDGYIVVRHGLDEFRFEWVSLNDEQEIKEVLNDTYRYVKVSDAILYNVLVLNNAISIEEDSLSNDGLYITSYYDGYEKMLNLFCPRVHGLYSWSKPKKDIAMGNACKKLEDYFKSVYRDIEAMFLHIHMSCYNNDLVLDVYGAYSLEEGMGEPLQSVIFGTNPIVDKLLKKIVDITESDKYPSSVKEIYILLDDYFYNRSIDSKVIYRVEDGELILTVY